MKRPCHTHRWVLLVTLTFGSLLAGCSDTQDELRDWMEQQRREIKPRVPKLLPPRKFDPQPYVVAQEIDPFSTQKLVVALKQETRQPNSLLAAELNRRKEPLEAYPLDALSLVGSLSRGGQRYALLKVDNLLYQVKVGEYVGQNYGKVTKITETEVALREIVQDAVGEWVERTSALQLQERAQEKGR
jgi:type IV pilus assembly protein PilP